jgi:hypothetical protein
MLMSAIYSTLSTLIARCSGVILRATRGDGDVEPRLVTVMDARGVLRAVGEGGRQKGQFGVAMIGDGDA